MRQSKERLICESLKLGESITFSKNKAYYRFNAASAALKLKGRYYKCKTSPDGKTFTVTYVEKKDGCIERPYQYIRQQMREMKVGETRKFPKYLSRAFYTTVGAVNEFINFHVSSPKNDEFLTVTRGEDYE